MLTRPQALAVARMGLGTATIINTVEMGHLLGGIASGAVALPVHHAVPGPTPPAVTAYVLLALGAALALTVGWRSATAAAVTTFLNVMVFLWDQQTYSSHRLLATLLVAYLAFAGPDRVWALRPTAGPLRDWAVTLMMTQLSICYLFAGLSKMTPLFMSGLPLSQWVWLPLPPLVFTAMAVTTVVIEPMIAIGLWLPKWRGGAVALGIGLHSSIVLLMSEQTWPLVAFSITCLCVYPLFWTRPRAPEATEADRPAAIARG